METELEKVLKSFYKEQMIAFMQSSPESFAEAMQLALSDKQPYSWRSAWLLWDCMSENDERIQPYIDKIIHSIATKKDGHQRELLKILSIMQLNEDQEGYLLNICLDIWEKIGKNPSVRYTALRIAIKLAQKHKELANEIAFFTQEHYIEPLSPGIRNAVHKMVNELTMVKKEF